MINNSALKNEVIIKSMEANMHLHMTYFTHYVSTLDLISGPDVTLVHSSIEDDTFNYVLAARYSSSNALQRVKETLKFYEHPKVPFSWWVGPNDTPKELVDILTQQGLSFKEENIGMYLDLSEFKAPEKISELSFQQVFNQEQLRSFAHVIESIGASHEAYEKIYSQLPASLFKKETPLEMYIGYFNNIAVVTGVLVLHANVAGLYYVATDPSWRKKGYGTAMMIHLINRAQSKNYNLVTLQASRDGKNLYEKLGFKEICVFKEYTLKTDKSFS
jgi:GNAT superfamily N-acetyltransferase